MSKYDFERALESGIYPPEPEMTYDHLLDLEEAKNRIERARQVANHLELRMRTTAELFERDLLLLSSRLQDDIADLKAELVKIIDSLDESIHLQE